MIKNRIISSLRTIISTLLLVIADTVAIYAVDYISADFTIGPWYNAIIIVIAFAIATIFEGSVAIISANSIGPHTLLGY